MVVRPSDPDWENIEHPAPRGAVIIQGEEHDNVAWLDDGAPAAPSELGAAGLTAIVKWLRNQASFFVPSPEPGIPSVPIDKPKDADTTNDCSSDSVSFHTALISTPSLIEGTVRTAPEALSVATDGAIRVSQRPVNTVLNQHETRVQATGIAVPPQLIRNWSGFGQHVQFPVDNSLPITHLRTISRTSRAAVDTVKCGGHVLARKSMICHRRFKPEKALEEVRHLQFLRHRHIVQCIGSYVQGRRFGVLTYPATRCNLDDFMHETSRAHHLAVFNRQILVKAFGCLVHAMQYFHSEGVKHMDIKPQNILVDMDPGLHFRTEKVSIFFTDFGEARTVQDQNQSKTTGPTAWTPMYASPEVAEGNPRGRSADIFSLGCVFAEMATVIDEKYLEDFFDFRSDDGSSFCRNLPLVHSWVNKLSKAPHYWDAHWKVARESIINMLQEDPDLRPSALDLTLDFPPNMCCRMRPECFEGGSDSLPSNETLYLS